MKYLVALDTNNTSASGIPSADLPARKRSRDRTGKVSCRKFVDVLLLLLFQHCFLGQHAAAARSAQCDDVFGEVCACSSEVLPKGDVVSASQCCNDAPDEVSVQGASPSLLFDLRGV